MRAFRTLPLAALLAPAVALAQAPPKTGVPPKSQQLDPNGCSHATVGRGEPATPDARTPKNGSLSERLAQSGGVLCPPAQVDPAIKVPTPPAGTMPVIPPPGTPGGDPNVRPK